MDGSSFDTITRRLAVTTSRRGGIVAIVAGALGIAGISTAEARRGAGQRHEKLACRNDQSECTTNDQCCSGICRLKPRSRTEYRCVGRKKKKKEPKDSKNGGGGDDETCLAEGEVCPLEGCCQGLGCYVPGSYGDDPTCKSCGAFLDYCNEAEGLTCCNGLACGDVGGPSDECCKPIGGTCVSFWDCCGYKTYTVDCRDNVCTDIS